MEAARISLRDAVECWLAPNRAIPIRIQAFRLSRYRRGVRIEAKVATGNVAFCFFRHDNGAWHVFPPRPQGPALKIA